MKILIDGSVFIQENEEYAGEFWKQLIPLILPRLRGDTIYYLNRSSDPDFPDIEGLHNLFAPPINWSISAIEDRRLAALCRELDIDVFLTTYNTSAGIEINSLFVVCDPCQNVPITNVNLFSSRQRAVRLASSYLAIYRDGADHLNTIFNVPQNIIQIIYSNSSIALNWTIVANYLSTTILKLSDTNLPVQITARHIAEVEATQAEAVSLRNVVYGADSLPSTSQSSQVNSNFHSLALSRQTLSVCMMVQNSEKTLALALESLENVYDELIVIDGGSTDSTCKIALSCGAKIIHSPWQGNHSQQRNIYLKEVTTDWVFVIDSDEFIDQTTLDFLEDLKLNGSTAKTDNFWITRKWIHPFSKNHYVSSSPHFPDWQRRIFRYNKSIAYSGQIHESIHGLKQPGEGLLDLGVYHLDLLLKSESQRQEKVQIYMKDNPNDGMPHYYLPDIAQLSLQKWNHQDLLPEVRKLLNAIPMKCKVCESDSHHFANGKILGKYDVDYFQCSNCGFVQTEEPYWLEEAYSQPIATRDVGLAYRNLSFSQVTANLLFNFFNHQSRFLDYGGGYGLFVRLMRDAGFNFYWFDKFCKNIFAQGFEIELFENKPFELVTAFEVFEHLVNPIHELEKLLKTSQNILLSTEFLPENNPKPHEWWYYALHEGQHVSIYTAKSLSILAAKFNLNLYSNGSSLHLLTEKELPDDLFEQLAKGELPAVNKVSLLQNDFLKSVEQITNNQESVKIESGQILNNYYGKNDATILVDGIFFQRYQTGIARVWRSLLEEWAANSFAQHIIVLDRAQTAPKIPGIRYRSIPPHDYNATDADREMLQQICDEEGADLFISTYYTTPISTPSVFMAYDMIPEVLGADFEEPMWQEKHYGIQHASAYIAISQNTARDLAKFFPHIPLESIAVAECGVDKSFAPATEAEVERFKTKYGIGKPYFLAVGIGSNYKNSELFFQAFASLYSREGFAIVCTGSGGFLPEELRSYTAGTTVYMLHLNDEELRVAYAGAVALVYPSLYEGFGLPVLEAMACGCPIITCPNASIPEVAGEAAIYVKDNDVAGMANALCEVQKPTVRNSLILAGLTQAQKFSWLGMADKVSAALMAAATLPFNLKDINLIIFPDWCGSEEGLGVELGQILSALASHPDKSHISLLIYKGKFAEADANLFLSGVAINLLMEADLEIEEEISISLIGSLGKIQWDKLLPRLEAQISLEVEDATAIPQLIEDNLPTLTIDTIANLRGVQLVTGGWKLIKLSALNFAIFPDWQQDEESLCQELAAVMTTLINHPESSQINLFIDISNTPKDEANLILSSVTMNLLMTEDWDVAEAPEITLLPPLTAEGWKILLPYVHSRIILEKESQEVVKSLIACRLDDLEEIRL